MESEFKTSQDYKTLQELVEQGVQSCIKQL